MKELIYIAVDANATHMYLPGVRPTSRPPAAGRAEQEITEVLEFAATLGIHAMNIGSRSRVEVLEEKAAQRPRTARRAPEQIKAEFSRSRGLLACVLGRDPGA